MIEGISHDLNLNWKYKNAFKPEKDVKDVKILFPCFLVRKNAKAKLCKKDKLGVVHK